MHPMLNIAVRAARNAGSVIVKAFSNLENVEVMQKGVNDFVTSADQEAEAVIINTLKKAYPDHSFLGEESGHSSTESSDYQWVIDPLDGTTNFLKGVPHFAISIALRYRGKNEQAVVYDPIRDELFTASRGSGAQLNDYRIRTGNARDLSGTLLATGFPHRQKGHLDAYTEMFKALFVEATDIRRSGSAALDLAYVAAGRYDGFWEIGLKPWDTAAGELIAREAGAIVTDFVGGHNYEKSGNLVVGNPRIVKALLAQIRGHLTDPLKR